MHNKPAVIDCGTGYTKLGFAGNEEPLHIIPTAVASKHLSPSAHSNNVGGGSGIVGGGGGAMSKMASAATSGTSSANVHSQSAKKSSLADVAFAAGWEALSNAAVAHVTYPIKHAQIEDWDVMERLWGRCIFEYLRCEPEDHAFVLTEPPMNAPENREYTAEIMFETFNVPALYIGVQAVLALAASFMWSRAAAHTFKSMTGTVVDVGDGVTHIIPVIEGYVAASAVRHVPIGGKEVTHFVQNLLRERESLPAAAAFDIAKHVKETHCYVAASGVAAEWRAFDAATKPKFVWGNNESAQIEVGFEAFLAPEIFFDPTLISSTWTTPLPQLVDEVVLACPIDARRALYANLALSGGSTMFAGFGARLQQDIEALVGSRHSAALDASGVADRSAFSAAPDVHVHTNKRQKYAVWYGASQLADVPQFGAFCTTRRDYDEHGPAIFRASKALSAFW